MSRDKQIEEMARGIIENTSLSVVDFAEEIAEYLYRNGYRKVSEIFEEIDKIIADIQADKYLRKLGVDFIFKDEKTTEQKLAELKKKYESEGAV